MAGAENLFCRHFEDRYIFGGLTGVFYKELPRNTEPFFFCIGADRSSGDCYGPLTGTLLKQLGVPNVLGTLEKPVHAVNLAEAYGTIPGDKYVVAVDASLGRIEDLGCIKVSRSPLIPGKAMDKNLPAVGNMSVILNVSIGGIANYLLLQSASFYMVWKGANITARSIFTALYMIKKEQCIQFPAT
ncbi:MAG TPA: spore protease YyaC [Bacillota bacterium]|nr:spore protease YyaC [Bacillota bacterium]